MDEWDKKLKQAFRTSKLQRLQLLDAFRATLCCGACSDTRYRDCEEMMSLPLYSEGEEEE